MDKTNRTFYSSFSIPASFSLQLGSSMVHFFFFLSTIKVFPITEKDLQRNPYLNIQRCGICMNVPFIRCPHVFLVYTKSQTNTTILSYNV